jgi:hypothetical protein
MCTDNTTYGPAAMEHSMPLAVPQRPLLFVCGDALYRDGETQRLRIVLHKDVLSVGCTDINVNALDWLYRKVHSLDDSRVIQG